MNLYDVGFGRTTVGTKLYKKMCIESEIRFVLSHQFAPLHITAPFHGMVFSHLIDIKENNNEIA